MAGGFLIQVLWGEIPGAALAGERLELPFTLSTQPVESVLVTLSCGERLEVLDRTLLLTPAQSRSGAVFRLKTKDDGGQVLKHNGCGIAFPRLDIRTLRHSGPAENQPTNCSHC